MKSKVEFDLNGQNECVVRAKIIKSDDIRDKVAERFLTALGYESNLALVRILPDTSVLNVSSYEKVKNVEVRTFPNDSSADRILEELCNDQKQFLLDYLLRWKESLPKAHEPVVIKSVSEPAVRFFNGDEVVFTEHKLTPESHNRVRGVKCDRIQLNCNLYNNTHVANLFSFIEDARMCLTKEA